MNDYSDIREHKKSRVMNGKDVTVIVWIPGDGEPPFVHSVIISKQDHNWSEGDPNRPSYAPTGDLGGDVQKAFEAGFAYAERFTWQL